MYNLVLVKNNEVKEIECVDVKYRGSKKSNDYVRFGCLFEGRNRYKWFEENDILVGREYDEIKLYKDCHCIINWFDSNIHYFDILSNIVEGIELVKEILNNAERYIDNFNIYYSCLYNKVYIYNEAIPHRVPENCILIGNLLYDSYFAKELLSMINKVQDEYESYNYPMSVVLNFNRKNEKCIIMYDINNDYFAVISRNENPYQYDFDVIYEYNPSEEKKTISELFMYIRGLDCGTVIGDFSIGEIIEHALYILNVIDEYIENPYIGDILIGLEDECFVNIYKRFRNNIDLYHRWLYVMRNQLYDNYLWQLDINMIEIFKYIFKDKIMYHVSRETLVNLMEGYLKYCKENWNEKPSKWNPNDYHDVKYILAFGNSSLNTIVETMDGLSMNTIDKHIKALYEPDDTTCLGMVINKTRVD